MVTDLIYIRVNIYPRPGEGDWQLIYYSNYFHQGHYLPRGLILNVSRGQCLPRGLRG